MKEEILNNINMIDIVERYGIPHKRRKIRCPFHGVDKHPSAQIYDTAFHCFTCGKHLDVIGFVQEYFNLDFLDAMQKINLDFNLGLNSNKKINYEKLNIIKNEKENDKRLFNKLQKEFCNLCDLKFNYLRRIELIDKKISITNWDEIEKEKSILQDKIELIEIQLDFLIDEMYEFRRTRI